MGRMLDIMIQDACNGYQTQPFDGEPIYLPEIKRKLLKKKLNKLKLYEYQHDILNLA